jgi:hypothetical protein
VVWLAQEVMRNLDDALVEGRRCGSSRPPPPGDPPVVNLHDNAVGVEVGGGLGDLGLSGGGRHVD